MTFIRLVLLLFLCLLIACEVPEQSRRGNLDTARDVPGTIAVVVWVVTARDGTGNALWTPVYAARLLEAATALLASTTRFALESLGVIQEDVWFALRQRDLLEVGCPAVPVLAQAGMLTVLISRPNSVDSVGISWQAPRGQVSRAPCFVMQARTNDVTDAAIFQTARTVFLHELGHQLGLHHAEVAARMGEPLHTDNYPDTASGWALVQAFAAALAEDAAHAD